MDFYHEFKSSLHTELSLTKTISLLDYLPRQLTPGTFLTEDMPCIQAFGEVSASFPYHYEISNLESYCMIFTESGSGSLSIEGNNLLLLPNTLAFIDCRKKHRLEIRQSAWSYKVFFMKGNLLSVLFQHIYSIHGYSSPIPTASCIPAMIDRLSRQLSKETSVSFLHIKCLADILMEIITEAEQISGSSPYIPEYLIKIKYNLDNNYSDHYSLSLLEQEYHISKYRMCREFKEIYRMPPIQYLNFRRIEAAKEALLTTDKKVNEIGRLAGFENMNLFIRLFKKNTGITPSDYKKRSPVPSA